MNFVLHKLQTCDWVKEEEVDTIPAERRRNRDVVDTIKWSELYISVRIITVNKTKY